MILSVEVAERKARPHSELATRQGWIGTRWIGTYGVRGIRCRRFGHGL